MSPVSGRGCPTTKLKGRLQPHLSGTLAETTRSLRTHGIPEPGSGRQRLACRRQDPRIGGDSERDGRNRNEQLRHRFVSSAGKAIMIKLT